MKDFDHKDKKIVRKEKIESKKNKRFDFSEEKQLERKSVKGFKNKIRELREEELWDDWENEIY